MAIGLASAVVFALVACSSNPDSSANACTNGDTRQCVGAGACAGGQICASGAWSACDCGGDGGADAGSGDDAATEGGDASLPPATKGGSISITTYAEYGWGNNLSFFHGYDVGARFSTPYPLDQNGYPAGSCTRNTIGPCVVTDCPPGLTQVPMTTYGAGVLSITGANAPIQLTTPYTASDTKAQLWKGGEVVHATATGSDVPAFDLQLTAGEQAVIQNPPPPSTVDTTAYLSAANDYVATWTGVVHADVVVIMSGTSPNNHSVVASCTFPGAPGSGTIPKAVLQTVPGPDKGLSHYSFIRFQTDAVSIKRQGDWEITFRASFGGVYSNGKRASTFLAFQ